MTRNITTSYYLNGRIVRINTSKDANRAVAQCVTHMQINQYSADRAEVFDNQDGILHAQLSRSVRGQITIMYKRDPEAYHNKYALTPLLHTPRRKK